MPNTKGRKARFGNLRKLPSGRWQARYTGPDGRTHNAHTTFDTKRDAEAWLSTVHADIVRDTWEPPSSRAVRTTQGVLFGPYADRWLETRRVRGRPLADRTRAHYRDLLDDHILPTFANVPLRYITPEAVEEWHDAVAPNAPTTRAHAYSLLHAVLATATSPSGPLKGRANPAAIVGAGASGRVKQPRAATPAEFEKIVAATPDRYKLMIMLACFCALRFGEITELRRSDVDTRRGLLHIRRGVVRADGQVIVKDTKSGRERTVAIPPHLLGPIREHLLQYAQPGRDGLLFPARSGGQMAPSSLYRWWYPAREAAGREDLRFHDLRGTGATWAAQSGATLAELMHRLGHSTPAAALRYQSMAEGRDAEIARRLSAMAEGGR